MFPTLSYAVVFAQETVPVPGIAGWISAGTGIGLLGGVIYWLCWYHIPKILDTHQRVMDAKETQINSLVKDFRDESKELRLLAREQGSAQRVVFEQTLEKVTKDAKEAMTGERQECTRRMAEVIQMLKAEREEK